VANSDRLVRLINDILDLERMTSGRAPLAFRRIALEELVRQAIEAMQPMAEAEDVHLASDPMSVYIEADSDRLLQVMTNLLSNAIKFSPPRSTVRISTARATDGVTVSVVDEGRGVPADKLESIFDRFQQVDARIRGRKAVPGPRSGDLPHHRPSAWRPHLAEQNESRGAIFRFFLPERASISSLAEEATQSQFEQKLR